MGVFDLIPMVGSTIAGVIVSLVALTKGLPIGIATACFYIAYRFLEDYLLNPPRHEAHGQGDSWADHIATLIGGSLLGIIGALIAVPIAATIAAPSPRGRVPPPEPEMTQELTKATREGAGEWNGASRPAPGAGQIHCPLT